MYLSLYRLYNRSILTREVYIKSSNSNTCAEQEDAYTKTSTS